ncbi:hypothetical protein MYX77_02170 [Acidobacteriia bacterium AH_259_A11_L15]|nr:hypothetical protein [Acidobacteriia bacterium AH_259_A11_L15]
MEAKVTRAIVRALIGSIVGILLGSFLCISVKAQDIVGNLVIASRTTIDGVPAINGTTVISGSTLSTAEEGFSHLTTLAGDRINLGPETKVKVDREKGTFRLNLLNGRVAVRGLTAEVRWRGIRLSCSSQEAAVWEVAIVEENKVEIAVVRGEVSAKGKNQTVIIPAGQRVLVNLESENIFRKLLGWPARAGGATAITVPLALIGNEEAVVSPSEKK